MRPKTAQTGVARMQANQAPFDNLKLRQAMQAAVDTSIFPKFVFQGSGVSAEHHHVAQIHPEYFELPALKQDFEKRKNCWPKRVIPTESNSASTSAIPMDPGSSTPVS